MGGKRRASSHPAIRSRRVDSFAIDPSLARDAVSDSARFPDPRPRASLFLIPQRFFCDGRCMTGPSPRNLAGTAAIVLVPSIIFNALVVPDVANAYSVAILAIAILWPLWCVGNLLSAGTTDPGILPRLPRPPPTSDGRVRPRYKQETLPNGKSVTVKWNDTCNFYQPPRAHHCSVNNDCVDKFDHHCPWVGTTIGRRNYRTFIAFVFSTTLLCVYVMAVCALQIKIKHDALPADKSRVMKAVGEAPAAIVVFAVSFVGFWFVAVLSAFHAYLIATNQTTYESFRDGYSWDENPHNRGVLGNCWEVFCAPAQPSRFRFREPRSRQPDVDVEAGGAVAATRPAKKTKEVEMTRESKTLNANANANANADSGAAKYAAPDREGRAPRPSDGSNPRNASEKVSTHGGGKRGRPRAPGR